MSLRHLSTRAKEHLNLADRRKSAIKDHLYSCDICSNNLDMDSFTILKKCNSEYETKIHEALLIKKRGPKLNKQVYASGASFLRKVMIYLLTSCNTKKRIAQNIYIHNSNRNIKNKNQLQKQF